MKKYLSLLLSTTTLAMVPLGSVTQVSAQEVLQ